MKVFYSILLVMIFLLASCDYRRTNSNTENTPENGDLNNLFSDQNQSLTSEQKFQKEREKLIAEGWQEQKISTGNFPACYNFKPKKGRLDNYLEVYVGSGTDVAIKIMDLRNDECIRYVFVNSLSSYKIKNIPEGKYYLKIAYGKNWFSKIENGKCIGKFIKNPMYVKGEDILDFNIQYTADGYSIPSYRLQLDVISSDILNSFDSHKISENEFNK